MIETARTLGGGMVTAPHRLAAEAGLDMVRRGGNAVEALVATLAVLAVVYPHMTGLGGDGFWLFAPGGATGDPVAIDAAGRAGEGATDARYAGRALVPFRGPGAANTVPGAVSGWAAALAASGPRALPDAALLEPAIAYAEAGVPVARGLAAEFERRLPELADVPGFRAAFAPGGQALPTGAILRQPALAASLRALAADGFESFYRGKLARGLAADLARVGAPVTAADLARHAARPVAPLAIDLPAGRVFNLPPPTQGLVSLLILALHARLPPAPPDAFGHVHGLVEASKRAFRVRDAALGDPDAMRKSPACFLSDGFLAREAAAIDPHRAAPWPAPPDAGDTVWCGAIDRAGGVASAIGSVFFEFGSGVVGEETGVLFQNRGASFLLAGDGPRRLAPGRKPFHTLNTALAFLRDGRRMAYGTMGGEGQPQTQAAIWTRHVVHGIELQEAITRPRWLLGRTWGETETRLRIEDGFGADTLAALAAAGHDLVPMPAWSQAMGHAGAVVLRPDGVREGASDPRSDGSAACF